MPDKETGESGVFWVIGSKNGHRLEREEQGWHGVVAAGVGRTGGYGVPMAFGKDKEPPVAGPYRVDYINGNHADKLNRGYAQGWKLVSVVPMPPPNNNGMLMAVWDTRGPA